jgi:hypothetical protein
MAERSQTAITEIVIEDNHDFAQLISDILQIQGCVELPGSVRYFVCEGYVDFTTAPLAVRCAGQERAAPW